jgi:hypothetical protein
MVDITVSDENLLGTHLEDFCNPIIVTDQNLVGTGQADPLGYILVYETNLGGGVCRDDPPDTPGDDPPPVDPPVDPPGSDDPLPSSRRHVTLRRPSLETPEHTFPQGQYQG